MVNKQVNKKGFLFFLTLMFSAAYLNAAVERLIASRSGNAIFAVSPILPPTPLPGGIPSSLSIQDQYVPFVTPHSLFGVKKSQNIVTLRYDDSKRTYDGLFWSLEVNYDLVTYDQSGTVILNTYNNTLTINFDPLAGSSYKDKDILTYPDGFKAQLFIRTVKYRVNGTLVPTGVPALRTRDIFLDLEQETERYYNFQSLAPRPTIDGLVLTNNQLPIAWDFMYGAESYDVEWLFIDIGNGLFTSNYEYDFRNATRINTSNQYYNIPLAYPKGIVLFRVRGVGVNSTTFIDRKESEWSISNSSYTGDVFSLTAALPGFEYTYRLDFNGLNPSYNWQYSATYAEEGKRKEVISYFDGSLRNRQTTTVLNSDNTAIISETEYDFEGRGAVQLLPTPFQNAGIKFYQNFNPNFDKNDFDKNTNFAAPDPVSPLDETGKYYSNDPLATGIKAYTPDAEGYPYSRTLFKQDGSNRMVSQSGIGINHKVGSTHETKYVYGAPTQEELDRLFGNEVGNFSHYKKNLVRDANGQINVSYLDQEGRVIASALAGDKPVNMMDLELKPVPETITTDLLLGKNELFDDAKTSVNTITVSSPGIYSFDYQLNGDFFCEDEPCPSICKSCKYDLFIEVRDENNLPVELTSISPSPCSGGTGASPPHYSISCTGVFADAYTFQANLTNVGSYTITKKLSIDQASLATYQAELMNTFTICLNVPPVPPEPCLDCPSLCALSYPGDATLQAQCLAQCNGTANNVDDCTLRRRILLGDVSPGGQYFDNTFSNEEVLNITTGIFENNPNYPTPYRNVWLNNKVADENTAGGISYISSTFIVPGLTINNWNAVRANWQEAWADILVAYHPEICAWNYFCDQEYPCTDRPLTSAAINAFEELILADAAGNYFNPIDILVSAPASIGSRPSSYYSEYNNKAVILSYDDDYFISGCLPPLTFAGTCTATIDQTVQMQSMLQNYIVINSTTPKIYASVYYLLEDPDGIHLTTGGTGTLSADGITIPNDVVNLFRILHGDPSAPVGSDAYNGLFNGTTTRYQYFKNTYLFLRRLLIYKGFENYSCSSTLYPNSSNTFKDPISGTVSYNPFYENSLPVPPPVSATEDFKYQIRYPKNIIFEPILDACPPFDPDAIATAMSNITSGTNPDIPASCASKCEGKADFWMTKVEAECSLPPAQYAQIRAYLVAICEAGCDINHMEGVDNIPPPGISGPAGTFYTFAQVLSAYGCSSTVIVNPEPDNSAGGCSCDNFKNYIITLLSLPPYFDFSTLTLAQYNSISTAMNSDPAFGGGSVFTVALIQNWILTCAVSPSTDEVVATGALSSLPAVMKCLPKDLAVCSCDNLKNYATALGLNPAGLSPSDYSTIATSLNDDFSPTVDFNGPQVQGWFTLCNGSPANNDLVIPNTLSDIPQSMKCFDQDLAAPLPCPDPQASAEADYAYQQNLTAAVNEATQNYLAHYKEFCLSSLADRESFSVTYDLNEYYYTLFYYDQAGNLIKTVPPQGVHTLNALTTPTLQAVKDYRAETVDPHVLPFSVPAHSMVTHYIYNSLQQLTEQSTPDGGTSKFWYDPLGRIIVSQNAKQIAYSTPAFSYNRYDDLGRIYEVGEITNAVPMTDEISRDKTAGSTNLYTMWFGSGITSQMTKTFYDLSLPGISAYFGTEGQENIRERIATIAYFENNTTGNYQHATHYSYDIHGKVKTLIQENPELAGINDLLKYNLKFLDYEYDLVSGNVNKVSYQARLTADGDLMPDRFYHQYFYDSDNHLIEVQTSFNNVIWEKEAKYFYYPNGSLARTEIGDKQVQAEDFAYTILGWLKGVNSSTLASNRDIGKDALLLLPGTTTKNLNSNFGTDAIGYTMGYFVNDYKAINQPASLLDRFEAKYSGGTFDLASPGLFDGDIRHLVGSFLDVNENPVPIQGMAYQYDQHNRLRQTRSYENPMVAGSNDFSVSTSLTNYYNEDFHYDLVGNVTKVDRNVKSSGAAVTMDQLQYRYYSTSGSVYDYSLATNVPAPADATNKLAYVIDAIGGGVNGNDIDNQINIDNYQYDAIGNLIKDKSVGVDIDNITWSAYGKIRSVRRVIGSLKDDLEFRYDANGNRVCKIVKPKTVSGTIQGQDKWTYTYYINDAVGNIISTYSRKFESLGPGGYLDRFNLDEMNIFASSRVGLYDNMDDAFSGPLIVLPVSSFTASSPGSGEFVNPIYNPGIYIPVLDRFQRILGHKIYELSNHLENVIATLSDRKVQVPLTTTTVAYYLPDVLTSHDYYAFGAQMDGRGIIGSSYRYGFNGKEGDKEMKGEGNSYDFGSRIYDPRLGRWLSTDPLQAKYADKTPYSFASDNAINRLDPDGRDDIHFYYYHSQIWLANPNAGMGEKRLAPMGSTRWYTIVKTNTKNTYTIHNISNVYGEKTTYYDKVLTGVDAGNEIIRYGLEAEYTMAFDNSFNAQFKQQNYSDERDVNNLAALARRKNFEDKVNSFMIGLVVTVVSDGILAEIAAGTPALGISAANKVKVGENAMLKTSEIHFMQSSIKNTTGQYTVVGNAVKLELGILKPEVLRIDVWKDASGKIWTLDHRRLGAFKLAELEHVPVKWANPDGQLWKMSTKTGGTEIKIKFGEGTSGTIR